MPARSVTVLFPSDRNSGITFSAPRARGHCAFECPSRQLTGPESDGFTDADRHACVRRSLGAGNKVCDVMLRGMSTAPQESWE